MYPNDNDRGVGAKGNSSENRVFVGHSRNMHIPVPASIRVLHQTVSLVLVVLVLVETFRSKITVPLAAPLDSSPAAPKFGTVRIFPLFERLLRSGSRLMK